MTTKVHVITGGSKGIGFALVKELSARPDTVVIATARDPSKATELNEYIKTHPNVHVLAYDALSRGSADKLAEATAELVDGVDVLHANAGIFEHANSILKTPVSVYEKHMNVNFFGPLELFKAFYELLKKRQTRTVVFTSSTVGSSGSFFPLPSTAYGSSKAALNYLAKAVSSELARENFKSVAIHPGGVSTDEAATYLERLKEFSPELHGYIMANKQSISPEESSAVQLKTIESLTPEQNGKFLDVDGTVLLY